MILTYSSTSDIQMTDLSRHPDKFWTDFNACFGALKVIGRILVTISQMFC